MPQTPGPIRPLPARRDTGVLRPRGAERGVALLAALAFLVLLALIAGGLIMAVNSDHKLVQRSMGGDQALNVAEAGVAEAIERIRSGEVPAAPNPRTVAQIFLCTNDELPGFGPDTVALATWQAPGDWLDYSTPGRSDDALTVRFKMDATREHLMRFDDQRTPPIQSMSGSPIYVVRSTGRQADQRETIVAEVARARLRVQELDLRGAVVSGGDVRLDADVTVCGFDHREDTPPWTGLPGRSVDGGCNVDPSQHEWEAGVAVEDRPGAWSGGDVGPHVDGLAGAPQPTSTQEPNFYTGCWEALRLSEATFRETLGRPRRGKLPPHFEGIAYYTGDTHLDNVDGEGLLYVEGDLTLRGNTTFRGLVYATGHVVIDGSCWVLGSVVGGRSVHLLSRDGACAVLFSHATVEHAIENHATRLVQLSWREE